VSQPELGEGRVAQIRVLVKDEFSVLRPRSKTHETERETEEAKKQ
jgi:hypothetical protein